MDVIEAIRSTERIDEVLRVAAGARHRRDQYWWAAVDRLLDQRLRIAGPPGRVPAQRDARSPAAPAVP